MENETTEAILQLPKYVVLAHRVDVDHSEDHESGDNCEGYLEVFLELATTDDGVEGALFEPGGAVTMVVVVVMF